MSVMYDDAPLQDYLTPVQGTALVNSVSFAARLAGMAFHESP